MREYFVNKDDLNNISKQEDIIIKSISLNNVMMTYMEFKPHTKMPLHKHTNEQISFILKGSIEMIIDGKIKILKPGDFAIIPANIEHAGNILNDFTIIVDSWSPIREDYKQ